MLAGAIGEFAVGQFIDTREPEEDTTSERKPLYLRGSLTRRSRYWKGRSAS